MVESKIVAKKKVSSERTSMPSSRARKKPGFVRQLAHGMSKLGMRRKKKQKWRMPKGRHSKMRLKQRGKAVLPGIGWGSDKNIRGKLKGMEFVRVENLKELEKVDKKMGIIVGKVGKKKKNEIVKKANEMGFKILNKYKVAEVGK